ncbi:hypothetical protein LDENG_00232810 [Lucifuga dentata]|nr:hypothetical protein LDENG_00232810 [Lucifuga dentata]
MNCPQHDIYVGKNDYGLGKVHSSHKVFYQPWKGKEYWYNYYKVLIINRDITSQHIFDVMYNYDGSEILQLRPQLMQVSSVTNLGCSSFKKTATLEKKTKIENRWNKSASILVGISSNITAGVPTVLEGTVEVSTELTFQFSKGQTIVEENTHSIALEVDIPPNHHCRVNMMGYKFKTNIPYTAHLKRTYRNGQTRVTSMSGTYSNVEVGEVHARAEKCEPVRHAEPCP